MESNKWTQVITSTKKNTSLIKELIQYKDLLFLLVRRDFVKEFKQTILGPIWFVIQPIFQTLVLLFVFGKIGNMGPNGIPQISFYLTGTIIWNLFSDTLLKTSETFRANANVFGKVYFPRIIAPLSVVITNYFKLGVQLLLLLVVYVYEFSISEAIQPNWTLVFLPVYFLLASMMGLGFGLIISSLTTKYWDLRFLVQFGVQLLMFMSTVITPFASLDDKPQWMQTAIIGNPISSYIEGVRYSFLGPLGGTIYNAALIYSIVITFVVLMVGIYIFNKVEKNFMDTV
ncbi:MAG TPA: ABC transporter permease [Crocinitomix sp.]|nr:ABC transporter permease [Crocinitomix sp.]